MAKKTVTHSAEEDIQTVSEAEVSTHGETAEQSPVDEAPAKPTKKESVKAPKKAAHSAKYRESLAKLDRTKKYSLAEAIELVKQTSYSKFDGSVDMHVHLMLGKKTDDAVRGTVSLPHGTGKERKVVIIDEAVIEKIEKGWLDFDIAIATPDMMPKLAKLAKVLGPKGLMPNPKSGTVTADPQKTAEELKGGKVEFKADSLGNIHQAIGKVSWPTEKLAENFQIFLAALPKGRIQSVTLAPTMGAGAKVMV